MEKKYIVELYDENVKSIGGYDWLQLLIPVADKAVMVETAIQLLPCTEPDVEKIRKEAYDKGYEDATVKISSNEQAIAEKAYQSGLKDAWEAARKIAHCFLWESYQRETGRSSACAQAVLDHYSASEAIEKIRQYEQEKEKSEEQKKQESIAAEDVMRQYLDNFCRGRKCTGCPLHTPDFTCGRGKYFLYDSMSNEEVRRAYAIVLAKMKE